MKTITVHDAQARLPELLEEVARGEDVAISSGDGASFRLVPVLKHRVPGLHPGAIVVQPDFDSPVSEFYTETKTDPLRRDDTSQRPT